MSRVERLTRAPLANTLIKMLFAHQETTSSELCRLDSVDNPSLRVAHDLLAVAAPHSAHLGEKPFRVFEVVELQVDHHVVRILDRPHDVIATNPGAFAVGRVTVEGPLPAGEVRACSILNIGISCSFTWSLTNQAGAMTSTSLPSGSST